MLTALTKTILDRESELRNKWVGGTPMQRCVVSSLYRFLVLSLTWTPSNYRMGEPEDLKGAIVYLASDAAAFTTGVNLNVDGGYCLVNPTGWVIPVVSSPLRDRFLSYCSVLTTLSTLSFLKGLNLSFPSYPALAFLTSIEELVQRIHLLTLSLRPPPCCTKRLLRQHLLFLKIQCLVTSSFGSA